MRTFRNMFCADMKRAICSRAFFLTSLLMTAVELLSVGQMLMIPDYSAIEMINNVFAGTGSSVMLLMLFPLVPFSLSYAREEEERAVAFWMARVKTKDYVTSRYLAACISAFLVVASSFVLLTIIFCLMGHDLYNPELWYDTYGYQQILEAGKPGAFLGMYLTDRGLSAAMMAGCAVFISTVYPNQYLAFAGPVCIYFIVLRLFPRFDVEKSYLLVSSWVEGIYASPAGGMVTLLCKIGVSLLVCIVYYFLSVYFLKRRWHYA